MRNILRSIALLVILLSPGLAFTQEIPKLKLNIGAGFAHHFPTTQDGTWYQQPFQHDFDTDSLTYKSGIEYSLDERWSINAGYVMLGHTYATAYAVADENYDPRQHICLKNCTGQTLFNTKDVLTGGEVYATYTFRNETISPFITLGGAYMFHQLRGQAIATTSIKPYNYEFDGSIIMFRTGVGACYKMVCIDTTYYHGLSGQDEAHFPLSQRVLTTNVFLAIPLY